MTEDVIVTEHNVVTPVSTNANGDVVTDSSGNPAGNIVYPDHPANDSALFLDTEGGAVAVGTPVTTGDISMYSHGVIVVASASGSVAITGLVDGTTATAALRVADAAQANATTLIQATALPAGTYYIKDLAVKNLVFTATTATQTITMALKA